MDGNYHNQDYYIPTQKISFWINQTIDKESWKSYDDLHLDDIDITISRDSWFFKGIEFLRIANSFMHDNKFVLVLGFSISDLYPEIKELSIKDIEKAFDDTPPSLYLFNKTWPAWLDTLKESEYINIIGLEDDFSSCKRVLDEGSAIIIYKRY